jgi:PilZ domain
MSHRISLAGVIGFADGLRTIRCTVHDLSAAGAKLRVPRGAVLPRRFELQEQPDAPRRAATVVWRGSGVLGVRFDEYFLGRRRITLG